MPVSPGASGMQPRGPCRPWRGTLASGHKPRCGLLALQSLESNPQLSFATRMEDWTCLGQHKRQPEFPVVTRESRRNSRKTTQLDNICAGWNCTQAWRAVFRTSADPRAVLRFLDEAQAALP